LDIDITGEQIHWMENVGHEEEEEEEELTKA